LYSAISKAGLTGTIPSGLKGLRYVKTLHLNNNHLTGELPTLPSSITNL
jgi:hypothetical protein